MEIRELTYNIYKQASAANIRVFMRMQFLKLITTMLLTQKNAHK